MKLRTLFGLSCLGLSLLPTAQAKVWIPHGTYQNKDIGFDLNVDFKTKKISIGSNVCWISGKLTQPNKNKGYFVVRNIQTDGMICPYIKKLVLETLDGPHSASRNGARTIRVSHKADNSPVEYQPYAHRDRVNFTGYYIYSTY